MICIIWSVLNDFITSICMTNLISDLLRSMVVQLVYRSSHMVDILLLPRRRQQQKWSQYACVSFLVVRSLRPVFKNTWWALSLKGKQSCPLITAEDEGVGGKAGTAAPPPAPAARWRHYRLNDITTLRSWMAMHSGTILRQSCSEPFFQFASPNENSGHPFSRVTFIVQVFQYSFVTLRYGSVGFTMFRLKLHRIHNVLFFPPSAET